jgi:hypothetical protein
MNDKITPSLNQPPAQTPAASAEGLSRRRLVRAGLASAPVLAALQSNSVLAGGRSGGNCIRPSAFSSLTMAMEKGHASRAPRGAEGAKCKSPSDWKRQMPAGWADVKFIGGPGKSEKNKVGTGHGNRTPFVRPPALAGNFGRGAVSRDDLTLRDILESTSQEDDAVLARYVTAAFLSLKAGGGWLTEGEIKAIWENRGVWTTGTGESWTRDKTIKFFESVFSSLSYSG